MVAFWVGLAIGFVAGVVAVLFALAVLMGYGASITERERRERAARDDQGIV